MSGQTNITLIATEKGGVAIQEIPDTGSYMVLVSDENPEGAHATFMIAASKNKSGRVFRAAASEGSSGEHLTILWPAGASPVLTYMTPPKDEGNRVFNIKVFGT